MLRTTLLRTLAGAGLLAATVAATTGTAEAAPAPALAPQVAAYASAETATIHPGTMMYTDGAQCTANFVFTDSSGATYVGYAAHCAGQGAATDTDGCDTDSLPLGTRVEFVEGGSLVDGGEVVGSGTLAYSSWLAMQRAGETDADACAYNDFALVKVAADSVADVNPSVPFWGGPTGLDTNGTRATDDVYSYGNSSLRGGAEPLSPKRGSSLGDEGNGWSHTVYTATPGIPGDSGSAFLSESGQAVGTLSTVQLAPLAGANGVSDLAKELDYARTVGGVSGLALVDGTEPFTPLP